MILSDPPLRRDKVRVLKVTPVAGFLMAQGRGGGIDFSAVELSKTRYFALVESPAKNPGGGGYTAPQHKKAANTRAAAERCMSERALKPICSAASFLPILGAVSEREIKQKAGPFGAAALQGRDL